MSAAEAEATSSSCRGSGGDGRFCGRCLFAVREKRCWPEARACVCVCVQVKRNCWWPQTTTAHRKRKERERGRVRLRWKETLFLLILYLTTITNIAWMDGWMVGESDLSMARHSLSCTHTQAHTSSIRAAEKRRSSFPRRRGKHSCRMERRA